MRSARWIILAALASCGRDGSRELVARDAVLVLRADRARDAQLFLAGDGRASLTMSGLGDEVRWSYGRWEYAGDSDIVIAYDWTETERWVQQVFEGGSEIRPPEEQRIRRSRDGRTFSTVKAVQGLTLDWTVQGDPGGTTPIPSGLFERGVGHLPVEESK
jgi:hypothetical protein